jgi:hypothetical protein
MPKGHKLATLSDVEKDGHWLWKVEGEPGYWEMTEDASALLGDVHASYQNPDWGFICDGEKDISPWLNTILRRVEKSKVNGL